MASKRHRSMQTLDSPSPTSSISDAEDVALSLMMLSRDSWTSKAKVPKALPAMQRRAQFQCGTCMKVFRSSQALGGHKASHNRSKSRCSAMRDEGLGEAKVYECPVCFRVFGSGQALGGHKRVHLRCESLSVDVSQSSVVAESGDLNGIDLNLPATAEYDDVEISAVLEH